MSHLYMRIPLTEVIPLSKDLTSLMASAKLWGGRFAGKTDPLMSLYDNSLPIDKILFGHDITGSIAYAKAIEKAGILTPIERSKIIEGLNQVKNEWMTGNFKTVESDEDIHTANERRLGEIIGSVAGKLHTGRSRNEQVATDVRLWLRDETKKTLDLLRGLISIFIHRAEKEIDVLMPGYTHLQRAQPIRWSHFLLSHANYIQTDLQRLSQLLPRINQSPLGAGALAGNPFSIDRQFLAEQLGFEGIINNSLTAVSDRDFIVEWLSWASLTMTHISRIAEDLIIYSTQEFGFVKLADAYSTGSSLMPQKKNPDSLELLRGKAGRVFGHMAGFMCTLKSLPSSYNKDLQEDKEPLFDAVKTISHSLQILSGVISTLSIFPEKMQAALSMEMLATDLADYLVMKGVPFRETHHISGRAVSLAEEKKVALSELKLDDLKGINVLFEEDLAAVFDFEKSVERRNAIGGTSKSSVKKQIEEFRQVIGMQ
ncbi:putative argininosuccinate lyase [Neolecta irregularis DAH-3]|uniref:argininosuccinate lyase n=1 Tax=Neolecta irregularis (strain DAH-3) TaxID=1198029 RepID=A0A1U7LR43_NEOID|nr:putative argininosuccinate lyase [Neolecta irregularis DAH-3]|eukprot:OLL25114.1 putative argininosuccinate lyase [Neolecta irregularis DAH-3]